MPETQRFDPKVEDTAKVIYEQMLYDGPGSKPAWVPGGNSHKQQEARDVARAALDRFRIIEGEK
jgi:hypothetical protein